MRIKSPSKSALFFPAFFACALFAEPPSGKDWKLVFEDDFNCPREELDKNWFSDKRANPHILSSRWPENVEIENGILKLRNKKETRAGQDWTSGSIWTKKHFKYGYFECRYRYAAAAGVNNSFWLTSSGKKPDFKGFEIDINEGHYPDELNMTLHKFDDIKARADGSKYHVVATKSVELGGPTEAPEPFVSVAIDQEVVATKIRISSNHNKHFHIREIAAYKKDSFGGYPEFDPQRGIIQKDGVENFAKGCKAGASGKYFNGGANRQNLNDSPENAVDGDVKTSWISQSGGQKWIEVDFGAPRALGCVQFVSGWNDSGEYKNCLPYYKIEYFDGTEWVLIKDKSLNYESKGVNLSKGFNVYALEWNRDFVIYYFNGKEMWRTENDTAHYPAPVFLSAAITHWAHGVTDAADGTSMDVDYVKIWQADEDGGEIK